jgi:hypothetical protein
MTFLPTRNVTFVDNIDLPLPPHTEKQNKRLKKNKETGVKKHCHRESGGTSP